MSFIKGLLIGIFVSSIGYFVMTLNQKQPDPGQINLNAFKQTAGTKYAEVVFHEAAYQAIKGKTFKEACGNIADLHKKTFCEEGYYFVAFSNDINKVSHNLDSQSASKVVRIGTPVQGVSLGMALALRLLAFDFYKGPEHEIYQPYIEDGWGFHWAFQNYDPTYPFNSICAQLPNKKYCEFGIGRALFFKDFSPDKAFKISPYTLKGLQFASIFGVREEVKPSPDVPIEMFAYNLKNWRNVPNKSVECTLNEKRHFLDCMEAKAY
ncbi:hypothetical protein AZI86_06090 [Bdellovibrio bacteriovorus]|uniref:Uncharacterized protein n=1 Tax=Bdellovibrio bacteriovorus TaxID=959 RepID=A0A150WQ37_BDEBC|nr:hypothetical protein [Bdellovibrio bacteriovorus]KYG66613.1 hypothetical protein AZI86_06090 [Bdellovibrio bacteriovorus]